jgi:multidrug efflux pump subunit AcrA (membrane-fusion protein)
MTTKSRSAAFALGPLIVLVAVVLAACGRGADESVLYHCPMHPTYVSDHPGDCPICNMKLVPVEGSGGSVAGRGDEGVSYHCPMHPTYVSDHAGECPICHMALVPTEKSEANAGDASASAAPPEGWSVVHATPQAVHLAGVQTVAAVHDTVSRTVRAVGVVRADETRVHQVNTRISGWVEELSVNFTGQFVRAGDSLLTVYSPELLASQEEYLNALGAAPAFERSSLPEVRKGARELLASARARLLLLGVPERLIRSIELSGMAEHRVVLEAPATGYVTGKEIFAGAQIEPGMLLFTIADLSRVWIEADVYEFEASAIRRGAQTVITLPYDPGFRRAASITYVAPTLDPATRTLRVRVELTNADMALRPEMFANVEIRAESGAGVVIPDDAILDSGTRRIVFVETDAGTFEPREITPGVRSDGRAQVLAGVDVGDRVVVRANFLLDSESRLRAAISNFAGGHQHGATPSPIPTHASSPDSTHEAHP